MVTRAVLGHSSRHLEHLFPPRPARPPAVPATSRRGPRSAVLCHALALCQCAHSFGALRHRMTRALAFDLQASAVVLGLCFGTSRKAHASCCLPTLIMQGHPIGLIKSEKTAPTACLPAVISHSHPHSPKGRRKKKVLQVSSVSPPG